MREYIVRQCRSELESLIDEYGSKDRDDIYQAIDTMTDEDVCEAVQCHTSYTDKDFAEWVVSIYSINHRNYWFDYDELVRRRIWQQIAETVAYNCMNR